MDVRRGRGNVIVWDPFSADSADWTPLQGCESWTSALHQALWLADAAQEGDSDVAAFWRGEASKLLAPLLHAAALDNRGIGDLLAWIDGQVDREPTRILKDFGADAAATQLKAVVDLDPHPGATAGRDRPHSGRQLADPCALP